jgi:hypothetical protein
MCLAGKQGGWEREVIYVGTGMQQRIQKNKVQWMGSQERKETLRVDGYIERM